MAKKVSEPTEKSVETAEQATPKTGKSAKPVVTEEAHKTEVPKDLKSLELPVTATGQTLANWKLDLVTISKIQVSKEPDKPEKWVTVEGDDAVKIPASQHQCLVFLAGGMLISPRTDRGFAYNQWISIHSKLLEKYFGGYTIRIENEKATLPVIQVPAKTIIAMANLMAPVLVESVKLAAPRRLARKVASKTEDEEVDFIL